MSKYFYDYYKARLMPKNVKQITCTHPPCPLSVEALPFIHIFFKEIHEELQMVKKIFNFRKTSGLLYIIIQFSGVLGENINDAGEPVPFWRDIQV